MDYELLNEDEHTYNLKDPKGKELKIAKQSLSDALHEKIRGYAKGGLVSDEIEKESDPFSSMGDALGAPLAPRTENPDMPTPIGLGPQAPMQSSQDIHLSPGANVLQNLGVGATAPIVPSTPTAMGGEMVAPSAAAPPVQPSHATPSMAQPNMNGPLDQMQAANKQESQAQQQYYGTAQKAQEEANAKGAEVDKMHQTTVAGLEKQQNEFMNAFATQKIDPNRLWSSASTGSKISAAIGVILGGLGAGLTGGPNQALEIMNKHVDQDIDAQKAELGKKQTLYSMNLQKYQNEHMAYLATKAQVASALQGKLASAAAQMGTGQAKAHETQANAQINLYRQQINQQLASQKTLHDVLKYTRETGDLRYADYLPAETANNLRGRSVPGYGLATTSERADKANELVATTEASKKGINDLLEFTKKPAASFSLQDRAEAQATAAMLKAKLRTTLVGPGAVNESEWKLLDNIVANPTDIDRMSSSTKKSLETLQKKLDQNLNTSLTQYGLKSKPKIDFGAPVK